MSTATVSAALKSRVRRPQLLNKVMKPEDALKFFKGGQ
jgi:acetyl-CoA hydrolase